jgi:multiple antibiotic resistance protein
MIMRGETQRRKVKTADTAASAEGECEGDDEWETMIVSPLVFPLTVGAGSISLVVTQAGMVEGIGDRIAISACLIIHCFVFLATYLFSVPMSSRMGGKGSAVVTRVGGIILLSLAFIIFTNGLKVLLPGLG